MNITYETNGKAFMGWLEELPGAYVRGKTIDEANNNIHDEINAYCKWLGININDHSINSWKVVNTNAVVEEGHTQIILDNEKCEDISDETFTSLMEYLMISARNLNALVEDSKDIDKDLERTARPIVNRDNFSTIKKQTTHIISAQKNYLHNLGININLPIFIISCREEVVANLLANKNKEGNLIHKSNDGELWTILKVVRRIIWHDRFHANEIIIMNSRVI